MSEWIRLKSVAGWEKETLSNLAADRFYIVREGRE